MAIRFLHISDLSVWYSIFIVYYRVRKLIFICPCKSSLGGMYRNFRESLRQCGKEQTQYQEEQFKQNHSTQENNDGVHLARNIAETVHQDGGYYHTDHTARWHFRHCNKLPNGFTKIGQDKYSYIRTAAGQWAIL